jgi:hypothetical protein
LKWFTTNILIFLIELGSVSKSRELMEVATATVEINASGQESARQTHAADLLPALHRLDRRLEIAVKSMQAVQTPGLSAFRGLFIDREQVDRLLSLEPASAPLLL